MRSEARRARRPRSCTRPRAVALLEERSSEAGDAVATAFMYSTISSYRSACSAASPCTHCPPTLFASAAGEERNWDERVAPVVKQLAGADEEGARCSSLPLSTLREASAPELVPRWRWREVLFGHRRFASWAQFWPRCSQRDRCERRAGRSRRREPPRRTRPISPLCAPIAISWLISSARTWSRMWFVAQGAAGWRAPPRPPT